MTVKGEELCKGVEEIVLAFLTYPKISDGLTEKDLELVGERNELNPIISISCWSGFRLYLVFQIISNDSTDSRNCSTLSIG